MSGLPQGWCFAELGALIERIEAGLNVKCEERPPLVGEKGLVKISAVTWGQFNEEQSKTLPADSAVTERARIRTGDLLFSRANTIELVGATVLVGNITKNLYLSDKMLRLVVPEASKRWINFAMKTADTRKAIQEASSGNQLSMRNVSQEKLRQIAIPLAPLPEQKRIADKLDSVLARVDACRDRLDRIPTLLKRFRQSVLAAATSGRLTEDWRVTRSLDEAKRNPGATFPDSGAGASSVPEARTARTVGDLALDLRYGTSQKCDYHEKGMPVLRISNMGGAGQLDLSDIKCAEFTTVEIAKLELRAGDLLLIRSNGSVDLVGKCCIVERNAEGYLFAGYLMRLRVDAKIILPWYLYFCFSAPEQRQRIELISKSTSGVNNINSDEVKSLPLLVPPIEEQHEIVRRVETLFSFADRLEARYATARKQVEQLTPALLAKAFRGELVAQDPNDEPAAELLKRLAAQREIAPKARRGRKGA